MANQYITSEYKRWKLTKPINQRIIEPKNCLNGRIERAVNSHVEFMESEYKKAFEHFNVSNSDIPKRTKIVRGVDRSVVLYLDDVPVFVAYEPKVTSNTSFEHGVVFEYRRLYKEAGE